MILPSKSINRDQALLTVGAQILQHLDRPATVNALWDRVTTSREKQNAPSALPFWWFSLALDLLFSINALDMADGQLVRRHVV